MPNEFEFTESIKDLSTDELFLMYLKKTELMPELLTAVRNELQRRSIITYEPLTSDEIVNEIKRDIAQKQYTGKKYKDVSEMFRFLLFVPLSLTLLWVMFYLIGLTLRMLNSFSIFWLLVIVIFGISAITRLGFNLFGTIAAWISALNPYKKIGKWTIIPLASLFCIVNIMTIWGNTDLHSAKIIIANIIGSLLAIACTLAFCSFISSSES